MILSDKLSIFLRNPKMFRQAYFNRSFYYIKAFNKPNAVFVWIPKSAGTSVYKVLAQHGCLRLKRNDLVKERFPNKGIVTFVHQDYAKLVRDKYISDKFDKSSFKFCFSRNPYSRAISLFFYMKKEKRICPHMTFLEFCRLLLDADIPDIGLRNISGVTNVGSHSVIGLSMCNPQSRWLRDVEIDYTGKLENILHDLNHVLDRLCLPGLDELPKENSTNHDSFRKYYCQESKQIIEDFYSQDFEGFGYQKEEWL
jgi:hypothetical protein